MLRKFIVICHFGKQNSFLSRFEKVYSKNSYSIAVANLEAHVKTNPDNNPLVDSFGRHHTYLRIAITEKCNLRCKEFRK